MKNNAHNTKMTSAKMASTKSQPALHAATKKLPKRTPRQQASAPVSETGDVLKYPVSTEKSIRQIEFENTLVFVVDARATKADVKKAVEEQFKVKVTRVNVYNSFHGEKRAYVKLNKAYPASDISAELGLI